MSDGITDMTIEQEGKLPLHGVMPRICYFKDLEGKVYSNNDRDIRMRLNNGYIKFYVHGYYANEIELTPFI